MTIGTRIKQAREAAGLTQQQLADAMPARSARQISQWETGFRVPDRRNLARIAEALNISPAWIEYGITQN